MAPYPSAGSYRENLALFELVRQERPERALAIAGVLRERAHRPGAQASLEKRLLR